MRDKSPLNIHDATLIPELGERPNSSLTDVSYIDRKPVIFVSILHMWRCARLPFMCTNMHCLCVYWINVSFGAQNANRSG